MIMALQAIDSGAFSSIRNASQVCKVSQSTLQDRIKERKTPSEVHHKQIKLTKEDEGVIIKYVLKLDDRGFHPLFVDICS